MRLRDVAGLIVIDFIDMEESKNNRAVEKVLKDALARDRARIQMGKISGFGLMEISRQRRRLGVIEGATEVCPHCQGAGRIRSAESASLMVLRAVDIEAGKNGAGSVNLRVCTNVALYILNHKRDYLQRLLERRGLNVVIQIDDRLAQGEHALERTETNEDFIPAEPVATVDLHDDFDETFIDEYEDEEDDEDFGPEDDGQAREDSDDDTPRERAERHDGEGRRDRGRGRGRSRSGRGRGEAEAPVAAVADDDDDSEAGRRRRRGRRGGRRVREDGDRDGFTWVRGRTPSLEDPYVWFDPINPYGDAPQRAEGAAEPVEGLAAVADAGPDGEREGGRRRRRRGRGRGERGVEQESRAATEGMTLEGDIDAPIAARIEAPAEDAAPVEIAEAPKRRRVRRKAAADVSAEIVADAEAVEPVEAAEETVVEAQPDPAPAPEPIVVVEPAAAPAPEVDIAAIIAEDPAQIAAPPEKPKRGWWRR